MSSNAKAFKFSINLPLAFLSSKRDFFWIKSCFPRTECRRLRQRGEGGKVKWDTHRLKVHIEARMKNIPSPIPPNPKVIPTFIKKSLIPSFLGGAAGGRTRGRKSYSKAGDCAMS